MSKIVPSLAIAGLIAMSLVACSAPVQNGCEATKSGPNSSKVTVSGKFGSEPKVEIPSAFDAKETERTVAISGKGSEVAVDGTVASANFVVYIASTGKKFEATDYEKDSTTPFLIDTKKSFPGIYKALHCSIEGDRIVAIIPPADLFGADGPNFGVGATDSLVFVFDVKKVEPAPEESPEGQTETPTDAPPASLPTPLAWSENVPTVDLSGAAPVVTLPKNIPEDLLLQVITEGDGEVVDAGSTVTIDYQGTSWNTGEIFDQTYTKGAPATFPIAGVVPGFGAAMVGQTVGSTLLVSIPPKYAYGEDPDDPGARGLGGQTLVFVIQIRAIG